MRPHLAATMRLGLLAALLLLVAAPPALDAPAGHAGSPTNGAMAVDCDAYGLPGKQVSCALADGETFYVAVEILSAPSSGYFGWQTKLRWSSDVVDYIPAANPYNEARWPYCDVPARFDNRPAERSILFACVPFPLPSEGLTDVGRAAVFQFQCKPAGTTKGKSDLSFELVSVSDDPTQLGTHFIDGNFSPIEPAVASATVSCVTDFDRDGCLEHLELGSNPLFGGRRDPRNFWDFFDTPDLSNVRDKAITAADIARVVARFGSNDLGIAAFDRFSDPLTAPNAPVQPPSARANYHPAFDRSPAPGKFSGPADGILAVGDIALMVTQFGHSCAGASST